jgi:hypothetical protein
MTFESLSSVCVCVFLIVLALHFNRCVHFFVTYILLKHKTSKQMKTLFFFFKDGGNLSLSHILLIKVINSGVSVEPSKNIHVVLVHYTDMSIALAGYHATL